MNGGERPRGADTRPRGYVALARLAVLAVVGLGALQTTGLSDEGFSMPGIESQKAYDLVQERFPVTVADGATARVVFVAPREAEGHRECQQDGDRGDGGRPR